MENKVKKGKIFESKKKGKGEIKNNYYIKVILTKVGGEEEIWKGMR